MMQSIQVIFYGTPEFAVPSLQALLDNPHYQVRLVVTQPDRPAGRGTKLQASPIKRLAESREIPVIQPHNIRSEVDSFASKLVSLGPFDIGVVVAFGQIIPVSVLQIPEKGSINVHASLLPRWRGAAPIQRAIMAGDDSSGVCLMRMEAGLDTGPVFSKQEIAISPEIDAGALHDQLSETGARLLVRDLTSIVSERIVPEPQDESLATYAKKISNQEAEINWLFSATELANRIRGLAPFPGAFTWLHGKRLKVLKASCEKQNEKVAPPGTVIECSSEALAVQCQKDKLLLKEVQLDGKKRMCIADFLRGNKISLEDKFSL
ncbi:MAG: methionyl-tRNA formyltransferase [Bdellovibrionales bacterium]|nr:methionyl-tRNA formyltransferase [Bdellovibrionales bacterium]